MGDISIGGGLPGFPPDWAYAGTSFTDCSTDEDYYFSNFLRYNAVVLCKCFSFMVTLRKIGFRYTRMSFKKSGNAFVSRARGLRFKPQAVQIGHRATAATFLRKKLLCSEVMTRRMSPENSLHASA